MTLIQTGQRSVTPPSEPCSRSARRFATAMELRGVKEQTALLKKVGLRLKKLTEYLKTQEEPTKLVERRLRKRLQELSLLLLDGKVFLVGEIHSKVLKAQETLSPQRKAPVIFLTGKRKEKGFSDQDLVSIKELLQEAYALTKKTKADLAERFDLLCSSKKRPKKEKTEEEPSEEEGLQEEESSTTASKKFKDFLESAKDRGWKVTEIKKVVVPEVEITKFDPTLLISQKEVTEDLLLDEETDIGLVRVPILVSLNNSQTIYNLVQAAQSSDAGYSIFHCYSKFYIIDGAICLGLNRAMVRSIDKDGSKLKIKQGKPTTFADLLNGTKFQKRRPISNKRLKRRVDIAKFYALIPFLQKEEVMYADLLQHLSLSTIPYRFGHHYYCPFLPKDIAQDLDFLIESWTFLLKRSQKP